MEVASRGPVGSFPDPGGTPRCARHHVDTNEWHVSSFSVAHSTCHAAGAVRLIVNWTKAWSSFANEAVSDSTSPLLITILRATVFLTHNFYSAELVLRRNDSFPAERRGFEQARSDRLATQVKRQVRIPTCKKAFVPGQSWADTWFWRRVASYDSTHNPRPRCGVA